VTARSGPTWLGQQNEPPEPHQLDRVAVYQCRNCGQGNVVVEEQYIGENPTRARVTPSHGELHFRGVHWWPSPGTGNLGLSIPAEIRKAYSEGAVCLGSRAPRAAAVMFRRTIEAVVRGKGSEAAVQQLDNNDLRGAIGHMASDHTLAGPLAEWAEDVRGLGNVGGHFDQLEDVSIDQATDLAHLVRQMLRYLYEEPARAQRLRDSRVQPEPDPAPPETLG
jgi:Domain of unknown function (DUF4145)